MARAAARVVSSDVYVAREAPSQRRCYPLVSRDAGPRTIASKPRLAIFFRNFPKPDLSKGGGVPNPQSQRAGAIHGTAPALARTPKWPGHLTRFGQFC